MENMTAMEKAQAQALCPGGLADSIDDATEMLVDMGEISDSEAERMVTAFDGLKAATRKLAQA